MDTVNNLPRCMDLITPEQVVEAIGACIARQDGPTIRMHRLEQIFAPDDARVLAIC
jgi:hypothetical protein